MLEKVSSEIVAKVIAIFGQGGLSDEELSAQIGAVVANPITATRLQLFIPEAFGEVLVSRWGKVTLSKVFSAKTKSDQWKDFPLTREPIYTEALRVAQDTYDNGQGSAFRNVATRSAIYNAAHKVKSGGSIDGCGFTPVAVVGIPAEIYSDT